MFSDGFRQRLLALGLSEIRQFDQIDSTNNEALRWLESGAPDLALVIADAQTAGRGRQGRAWFTPPQAALAFSLILIPSELLHGIQDHTDEIVRYTALGALAVCQALRTSYYLPAEIKWPNDVLLAGKKVAGILAEASWQGTRLTGIVVGIGVNISPASIPPVEQLNFPATCVEAALEKTVDRLEVLLAILAQLLHWRKQLSKPAFWQTWDEYLAWRGNWVQILVDDQVTQSGQLLGLDQQGQLLLRDAQGRLVKINFGELRLRPAAEASP